MKHLIKIESAAHGVLGVRHAGLDQQYCEAGETVILKWQPDAKWGLQEAHYTDSDGNIVPIDLKPVKVDGKDEVVFTMPDDNITVGGTFKRFVVEDWTEGLNPSVGDAMVVGDNGQPTPIKSTRHVDGTVLGNFVYGAISADGSLTTTDAYRRITIENDNYINIKGVGSAYINRPIVGFYNDTPDSSSFIGGINAIAPYVDQTFNAPIPEGTKYIVVSNYRSANTDPAEFTFTQLMGYKDSTEAAFESIENLEDADRYASETSFPQINNNPLPKKSAADELDILIIGSSWGVDTMAALADISTNLNLNVGVGILYKSGGTIAQYLNDIKNGSTNTLFFNQGGTNESVGNFTVIDALHYKTWDIIVLMEGANDSVRIKDGANIECAELLQYCKVNATNPNVCFALNSTWTEKDATKLEQKISYKVVRDLMRQTGIDLMLPIASSFRYLQNSGLANEHYKYYRDGLHLNLGITRFTASCAVFLQIVAPIYGIDNLSNCTLNGNWSQASGTVVYPTIDVSDDNRATCINCARKAVADQFKFLG